MKDGSINRSEVECLFTELKGHTQQNEMAYRAVIQLERLYISHLENRISYESEEDRGKALLKIVKAMMHVNSFVSMFGHIEKYLVPVRELFQRFLDDE